MAYTTETVDELRRGILFRATELQEVIANLRGQLGRSKTDLHKALDLVHGYPSELLRVLENEWARNTEADSRFPIFTTLLRHTNFVADFVEKHLAHGTRRELSEALVGELRQELNALGLGHYRVVTSHGEAFNFTTTYGDLRAAVFAPLLPPESPAANPELFAFFQVPRIEGSGVQWRPVLLGHEVAHVAVRDKNGLSSYDVWSKFDVTRAEKLPNPRAIQGSPPVTIARGLYQIAESWATELLCDAHALHRYGPAAIAALAEYLSSIGGLDARAASTHPPGILRLRLLLNQVVSVAEPRWETIVRPWRDVIPGTISLTEPWADYLASIFLGHSNELYATAASFGAAEYRHPERSAVVTVLANAITAGIPGREIITEEDGSEVTPLDADVVNAVWISRGEGVEVPFDALGKKALESLEFVRRWIRNGGLLPSELYRTNTTPDSLVESSSALSEVEIIERLKRADHRRLVVQPLLQRPKGTGIDLRLGNRFIAFRRSGTASFDPLELEDDPRSVQVHIELAWTETFVLHPQEVVLGATLEYLVFPADLTGQVVTRSSYGRLGLLSATAVQVHPSFHGCLTLELVNLSTIPITLTPGERIAQLVLWRTAEVFPSDEKYAYPIGPQFSRVRADQEAEVLRSLRQET